MRKSVYILFVIISSVFSCSSSDDIINNASDTDAQTYRILSLGDSYTIGESVCATCRFPEQLKAQLKTSVRSVDTINLKVIAQTGWTTTNLINAIADENPNTNYDLVTLLIGVNNQYQNKPFSLYEDEFPLLVEDAVRFAKGDKTNVIVVSIPDYAFTPFGQSTSDPQSISNELDQYNDFARSYCEQQDITFVNITDITRNGLTNPDLVASDGLHPSELAYSQFIVRLLPLALEKIQ